MKKVNKEKCNIEIMEALARGYCSKRNSKKQVDVNLIEDMGKEVSKVIKKEGLPVKINGNKGKKQTEESKIKMKLNHSKYWLGKHCSEESNKKRRLTVKGSKSYLWQGGKSFEIYPEEFNKYLKKEIRERDNYICQLCGVPQIECKRKLSVHHINYIKTDCNPSNLITLCRSCNTKVNQNRKYWIKYFVKVVEDNE